MRIAWLVVMAASLCSAQSDSGQAKVATQLSDMLHRTGHSPTTDEIQAAEMLPGVSDPADAKDALPLLAQALASPDVAVRKYALAMLIGMQSAADPSAGGTATAKPAPGAVTPALPAAYKAEIATILVPLIPGVSKQLVDDDSENRGFAATVLEGFSAAPPPAVFPPLLNYLKRDDAIGPVGVAVVSALLQLGPVSDETAAAIARYLKRSDQTASTRVDLVEAIAARPNQNIQLNKALLTYLDADDSSLRARVILSLPQLSLTPEMFADLKSRIQNIATGDQDPLPVITAAKSIAGCWTSIMMASGCPAY